MPISLQNTSGSLNPTGFIPANPISPTPTNTAGSNFSFSLAAPTTQTGSMGSQNNVTSTPNVMPSSFTPRFAGDTGSAQDNAAWNLNIKAPNAPLPYTPPTNYTPSNYNVPTGNTYSSNVMNSNANQQSLQQTQQQKYQDMTNGTGTNLSPTDALMQQIFQNKQYTPEEQANLQNLSDINSTITASTLAERRQIKQLQEDGMLTKEQASAFASEAQRRADAHLADLAAAQTGVSNTLGVQAAIRNNQLGAYQTLFDMTKGSQVLSPGQGLYNATGQQVAGAAGVAPQITSLAQQLYTQALSSGNAIVDPQTGQPNYAAYMQQASQLTGIPLPASSYTNSSVPNINGSVSGPQSSSGVYGSTGYGNVSQLPQAYQRYIVQTPVSDSQSQNLAFVQADKVPDAIKQDVKNKADAAGIPFLDSDGTKAFFAAQQILNVVDAAKALSIRNLSSGTSGRITNTLKAWANNFLQFNPDLSNFAQLKDAASKATSALAGGQGSGFRMNMGIIEAATANLPTANDSLENALTKADALGTQIINGMKPVFPNVTTGNYGSLLQSQYGSNQTQSTTSGGGWGSLGDK